jgi:putative SOS response-associated peptidase YedK
MCGRYTLHQKSKDISKRFNVAAPQDIHDNFNVAPGQIMPIVTETEAGRQLELMKWGLVPAWAKDPKIGYKLINARAETMFEKPMWRNAIRKRRCLVPADGFYEWKKLTDDKKARKQPYYIHPKQTELFAFAGIWESWHDAEGMEWKTYSIITTEPNKEMADIHDRMPVILHKEDESSWLDPSHNNDQSAIESLLHPYEDNGLDFYEVSPDVNSPRNNDKHLIYALD